MLCFPRESDVSDCTLWASGSFHQYKVYILGWRSPARQQQDGINIHYTMGEIILLNWTLDEYNIVIILHPTLSGRAPRNIYWLLNECCWTFLICSYSVHFSFLVVFELLHVFIYLNVIWSMSISLGENQWEERDHFFICSLLLASVQHGICMLFDFNKQFLDEQKMSWFTKCMFGKNWAQKTEHLAWMEVKVPCLWPFEWFFLKTMSFLLFPDKMLKD